MSEQLNELRRKKKNAQTHKLKKRIITATVAAVSLGLIAWAKFSGNSGPGEAEALFTVKKGDLRISVVEEGKIQAMKSVSLSSEVEGQSTIISIVPEGTYVKEGDVLVELDSADLRERIDSQEITVKSSDSAYTNASESYEIQKNQNESDIKAAELARDFALIDLKKYTGEAAYTKAREAYEAAKKQVQTEIEVAALAPHFAAFDPQEDYKDGDWHQQLLKAANDIKTTETSLKLAETKLEGTKKLREKGYVAQSDLDADQASYDKAQIDLEQVVEAEKLLLMYDHPKQLAKYIADYEEAEKELERADRRAKSQMAQKEADLMAKEATRDMQRTRLAKLKDQLNKTTIIASQPGLVVYSSSSGDRFRRESGLIAEGEKVWQRQKIIELPDLSTLKVNVSVHESVRDIIKADQKAVISVEALPGLRLRGHVEKVGILPDSSQSWMNPDLTVYTTSIIIDDKSEALKPGMTAEVEIIVADLEDVLYVPVYAVTIRGGREVCFGPKESVNPVEVGLSNDNYIEIKSGLRKGDKVRTYAPIAIGEAAAPEKTKETEADKEKGATPGETGERPTPTGQGPRQIPPEMLERAKTFLQDLSPEDKKKLGIDETTDLEKMTPEQMRGLFRKIMQSRGGPGAAGEGPRRGPRGEGQRGQGQRPGRRPPGGSGARPGAGESRASES